MRRCLLAVVCVIAFPVPVGARAASFAAGRTDVPDAEADQLAGGGGRVYFDGAFDRVGPWTGPGGVVDEASGRLLPGPRFAGSEVDAVIGDGQGGWYVAGTVPALDVGGGETDRVALVHVLADGALDPRFTAPLTVPAEGLDGLPLGLSAPFGPAEADAAPVSSLLLLGGRLYVGGNLTTTGSTRQSFLVALDPVTGQPIPAFDAAPTGPVRALASGGSTLYVGGTFNRIGGADRTDLAELDADTGRLIPQFDPDQGAAAASRAPDASGSVYSLTSAAGRLYAAGAFTSVGPFSRGHVAALDLTTGAVDPGFDPDADGPVYQLLAGDGLYLAGSFYSVGATVRGNLARVDLATGDVDASFAPPTPNAQADALALGPGRLFVGGAFTHIGGIARASLAALDPTTGALQGDFSLAAAVPGGDWTEYTHALASQAGLLYLGTGGPVIGGAPRPGLAAIDVATGRLDAAFQPPTAVAKAAGGGQGWLSYTPRRLYVEAGPPGILALDPRSGRIDPTFRLGVRLSGNTAFVAGGRSEYVAVGRRVARLDSHGRLVGLFHAAIAGSHASVDSLALAGGRLLISGRFGRYDGRPAANLVAVDPRTGALLASFHPTTQLPEVWSMTTGPGRVYVSGRFWRLDGMSVDGLAALDARSGALIRSFRPRVDATERGIVAQMIDTGAQLFAVVNAVNADVIELDRRTGATVRFARFHSGSDVHGLVATPGGIYAVGTFNQVSSLISSPPTSPFLARLERTP